MRLCAATTHVRARIRGPARPPWLTAAAAGLLTASVLHGGSPLLVWNLSTSSPSGLYAIVGGSPRAGDIVASWAPPAAAGFAAGRGYLPAGTPLVKTLAAGPTQHVCARGARLEIDGRLAAVRRRRDRAGRALPWWAGCRRLGAQEVLLLGQADAASFDGRYFGPIGRELLIGKGRLLWAD